VEETKVLYDESEEQKENYDRWIRTGKNGY